MCGGVGVTIITMWICYIQVCCPKYILRCKLVGEAASVHYSPFFAQLQAGELHLVHTLVQSILVISKYGAEHSGDSTLVQIQLESLRQIEKEWEGGGRERELARSNNCPCWLSLWGRRWRISTVLVDPSRPCTGNATSTEGSGWLTNILSVYIKVDSEPRHCSRDYNSFIPSHRSRARIEAASLPLQILI